jgi:glycosyltransferase involved in cell wall biosynthesis
VKVGFLSPLPPARTGVAAYAAALLPALGTLCDVRTGAATANVWLYQVGNNPLHAGIYRRALAQPGVAVLHDAVLHHLLLGLLDRQAYIEEFVYNYGEPQRGLAADLWESRSGSAQDARYFEYALVRRIAETSQAVVVHNPAAARVVRRHAPGARVEEIPHMFAPPEPPPSEDEARGWRAGRGIAWDTFLFGVFGHLRESKRLPGVLRAFERVRRTGANAALLVAGDFVSRNLEAALGRALAAPGVIREPYCPEAGFWRLAAAVDACISLRHPSAGETSGIAIRLMGLGKPVLVSAGEEVSCFPEDGAIRIDPGLAEEAMLVEYMMWLVEHPGKAREIGARAAAHIAAHHSLEGAARQYFELLSCCCR